MARLPRIYSRAPALPPLQHRRRCDPGGAATQRAATAAIDRSMQRAATWSRSLLGRPTPTPTPQSQRPGASRDARRATRNAAQRNATQRNAVQRSATQRNAARSTARSARLASRASRLLPAPAGSSSSQNQLPLVAGGPGPGPGPGPGTWVPTADAAPLFYFVLICLTQLGVCGPHN